MQRTTPRAPASPGQIGMQLALIRLAMLSGVVMFGGFSWWLRHSSASPRTIDARTGELLSVAPLVGGIAALIAVVLVRRALAGVREPLKQGPLCLIGWATGEVAAMLGAVSYFLSGSVTSYLIGLTVLVFTFVALPIPGRD